MSWARMLPFIFADTLIRSGMNLEMVGWQLSRGEYALNVDEIDFVRNRIESQAGYLDEIGQRFPGQVRAVVPLYDSDIRGIPSLDRATGDVFS